MESPSCPSPGDYVLSKYPQFGYWPGKIISVEGQTFKVKYFESNASCDIELCVCFEDLRLLPEKAPPNSKSRWRKALKIARLEQAKEAEAANKKDHLGNQSMNPVASPASPASPIAVDVDDYVGDSVVTSLFALTLNEEEERKEEEEEEWNEEEQWNEEEEEPNEEDKEPNEEEKESNGEEKEPNLEEKEPNEEEKEPNEEEKESNEEEKESNEEEKEWIEEEKEWNEEEKEPNEEEKEPNEEEKEPDEEEKEPNEEEKEWNEEEKEPNEEEKEPNEEEKEPNEEEKEPNEEEKEWNEEEKEPNEEEKEPNEEEKEPNEEEKEPNELLALLADAFGKNQNRGEHQDGKSGKFKNKHLNELSWTGLIKYVYKTKTMTCNCDGQRLKPTAQSMIQHIRRKHPEHFKTTDMTLVIE